MVAGCGRPPRAKPGGMRLRLKNRGSLRDQQPGAAPTWSVVLDDNLHVAAEEDEESHETIEREA